MGITSEAVKEVTDLLVQQRMVCKGVGEGVVLCLVGQFTIQKQVNNFLIGSIFRQLGNGVTTVQQNALVAINKGDFAVAGGCFPVTWVKRENA